MLFQLRNDKIIKKNRRTDFILKKLNHQFLDEHRLIKWTPGMNEAKVTLRDGSSDVSSLISKTRPTTTDHWQSESVNPQFTIDFDEPVEILDVVLKPKFVVSEAAAKAKPMREEEGVFYTASPQLFNFKNPDLTEGGRLKPDKMKASFQSIT